MNRPIRVYVMHFSSCGQTVYIPCKLNTYMYRQCISRWDDSAFYYYYYYYYFRQKPYLQQWACLSPKMGEEEPTSETQAWYYGSENYSVLHCQPRRHTTLKHDRDNVSTLQCKTKTTNSETLYISSVSDGIGIPARQTAFVILILAGWGVRM